MSPEGLTEEPPTGAVDLCVECQSPTNAPVAVRWVQTSSGPGRILWACPAHVTELVPGPTPGEL